MGFNKSAGVTALDAKLEDFTWRVIDEQTAW